MPNKSIVESPDNSCVLAKVETLTRVYPCEKCAVHFRQIVKWVL